tara:strand:+ start:6 stop:455 length:450 start_codon:yes stop_codon:yes gene_type:complete
MKFFKSLILIFFLSGCGYSTIYNDKNYDVKIKVVNSKGNSNMNSKIIKQIKNFSDKDSNNIINVNIDSNYQNQIISRSSTGSIDDYKIILNVVYTFEVDNNVEILNIKQDFKLKNTDESFERQKNESTLINNFITSSVRELFLNITAIK